MSVASRYLSCSLGVLLLLPVGLAGGRPVGVEAYRSGEVTVSLEWFAPAANRGRFPTVVRSTPPAAWTPGPPPSSGSWAATRRTRLRRRILDHFERTGHIAGALKDGELSAFVKAVEDGIDFGIASGIVDEDLIGVLAFSTGAYIAFSRDLPRPRGSRRSCCAWSCSLPVESRATFPPS